jgi:hypothetical protein
VATTKVYFEGEEYTGLPLNPAGSDALDKSLRYIADGNDFLTNLFRDERDVLLGALEVAKAELGGQEFTGLYASDAEIGMQLIRPGQVLRSTAATEAVVVDWTVTFTADGDYWIGFGTNNTTAINVDKRACVVPMGVWFTQGGLPTVEELYIQLGGTTYPVNVIRHAWLADNSNRIPACRIRPMIWKPKSRPLVQVYSISAATMEMVLVGVTFGLGDYIRIAEYTGAPQT